MEYAELLHGLFLGSRPELPADIDRLRQDSAITAVMNLQTDDDMRAVHVVWEPLEAYYRNLGIELCRMQVRDFDPADLRAKLPECVRALDRLLAANHCVYLHCTLGASRSPTVAIAYLCWCRGLDLEEAETFVKNRWKCTPNVEAIRGAVWSPPEK
jgi:protein-tyrosine phosphatase